MYKIITINEKDFGLYEISWTTDNLFEEKHFICKSKSQLTRKLLEVLDD